MRCDVCGQDYGVTHNCKGAPPPITQEEAAPPPDGLAPLYYLRLAFKIARWNDVSIRRAARDTRAGFYGLAIWAITGVVILLPTAISQVLEIMPWSPPAATVALVVGLVFALVVMGIITFVQIGLCHVIAKWFFGGTGTLLRVMRPLLLGWFVNALILIPVVGLLAAGIAWTAVLMLVFEEVDGIGRLQAFFISAGINVCFFVVRFAMHTLH
jgi:hypothetical protein